jgi:metal-responsive CopG/Arc/MetJ family transcriptional regulator
MSTQKIAITLDKKILHKLDSLVAERKFPNRSKAIQEAVEEKIDRIEGNRLARELAKLDPVFEQAMADEGLAGDEREWPTY